MSDEQLTLENVFWLGGSPCAGKSSIADILAHRLNFDLYRVDEKFDIHLESLDRKNHANLSNWRDSDWNQRWMQPAQNLLQNIMGCYREHFSFILNDILLMPREKPLLVEGAALLPQCVAPLLPASNYAIWLIPGFDFQQKHYSKRAWVRPIVEQCNNPEDAFQNWMRREADFSVWLEKEVESMKLNYLKIDGKHTIEENSAAVEASFCSDKLN